MSARRAVPVLDDEELEQPELSVVPAPEEQGDPALVEDRDAVEEAVKRVEAGGEAEIKRPKRHPKVWLALYVAALAALIWALPLLGTGYFSLPAEVADPLRRIAMVLLAAAAIRAAASLIEAWVLGHVRDAADRYNAIKVLDLVSWAAIVVFGLTQLFADWYQALASLGVVSLVLGLALQEPLSSFFAWIYILARKPYQVGDRIAIGDMQGDVIQVGYLDTTLWEFGGKYISGDHPSGRIIKIPNAKVLNEPVINYTWPLFPYRWDEIKFQIAYDADLEYVAQTMQRVVDSEIGEELKERIAAFRQLLKKTPVNELSVRERPTVIFRVHDNTWLQAIVRYVVDPRRSGPVKSKLIPLLLNELNKEPERVKFPKGDNR
ncbi:MAG TPA: mechanosensitive ion channel family protein [Chloroflexota bacterium]|nr:mechanosensitive ion channel family protein [Chloroflexota bacterium]